MRRLAACVLALLFGGSAAAAEIHVATQYGFGFLPMMVIEHEHLYEKRLAAAGMADSTVAWSTLGGGSAMNDALLSGSLDLASGGVAPFITLWAKARNVRAISALTTVPLWFNTRDPDVRTLEDLTEKDKIAVTAPKVSVHAILLQIAATKRWGLKEHAHYDSMEFALSQPDSMAALLSGAVNNHFSAPPFQYTEARQPGIRTVATADDIIGGPATFIVTWTTAKFRADNPFAYKAFLDATRDALELINRNLPEAAAIYLEMSHDKMPQTELLPMLRHPGTEFTLTPRNVMTYASAMADFGIIKSRPETWKDLFFPEIYDLPGS
jgi:NitT/TauT family transport system substrate-binding protein